MKFGKIINCNIVIEPTVNMGFRVQVGCANLAFEDTRSLLKALEEYLGNPKIFEKAYSDIPGQTPDEAAQRVGSLMSSGATDDYLLHRT